MHNTHITGFTSSDKLINAQIQLSNCLLNKENLDHILKTAEIVLGNPVFLSDTSTKVLCYSDRSVFEDTSDELIQCVLEHGFVTSELSKKYNYRHLLADIENSSSAFYRKSTFKEKEDRIIVKINVNGKYFGWLVLFPKNQELTDEDCQIMDIVAKTVSLEIERNKIGFSMSYRENLLMELISDTIESRESFLKRAEGFDWHVGSDFYIMAFEIDTSVKEHTAPSLTSIKNHLAMLYPTYKSIIINDILYLLLETANIKANVELLSELAQSSFLTVGCSRHFASIMNFRKYCEQAHSILRIGQRMNPERRVHLFEDHFVHHALEMVQKHDALKNYCHPAVRRLIRIDKESHTEYCDTLRAYLHYRNVNQTADALHIHKNTLSYRLHKITDITGFDLNSGDDIYKIWFSFMLSDVGDI